MIKNYSRNYNKAALKSNNHRLICQAIFLQRGALESFYKLWLNARHR